jgi:hypothetical protein
MKLVRFRRPPRTFVFKETTLAKARPPYTLKKFRRHRTPAVPQKLVVYKMMTGDKLNKEINAALADPKMNERFAHHGECWLACRLQKGHHR